MYCMESKQEIKNMKARNCLTYTNAINLLAIHGNLLSNFPADFEYFLNEINQSVQDCWKDILVIMFPNDKNGLLAYFKI